MAGIPTFFWSFLLAKPTFSMLANMMIYVIWESYLEKKLVSWLWSVDSWTLIFLQFLVETNLPSPFSGTMLIYWRLLTNIKADAIHILIIYGNSSPIISIAGGNFTGDLRTPPGHIMKQMCKSIVALAPSPRDRRFTNSRKFAIQEPNLQMWIS